jgi:hypothetical protein
MFTIPVPVAVQPRTLVQVIVYSQWPSTACIPDIAGVVSQTPVPQVTAPFARIRASVGVTPEQMVNGLDVGTHGVWMFTMPVAVAEQPSTVVHVIVYSQ